MDESSTQNRLILYLFNETDMADSVLIQKEIDEDPEVECEFENLKATLNLFDLALTSPSKKSVQNIIRFASQSLS
jgi:hypothetical protein